MFLSDDDLQLLLDTVNKTVAESMASGKEEASIGRARRRKTAAKLKVGVVNVVKGSSKFSETSELIAGNPDEVV